MSICGHNLIIIVRKYLSSFLGFLIPACTRRDCLGSKTSYLGLSAEAASEGNWDVIRLKH